jgi:outer membrane protein assembly factor BamB
LISLGVNDGERRWTTRFRYDRESQQLLAIHVESGATVPRDSGPEPSNSGPEPSKSVPEPKAAGGPEAPGDPPVRSIRDVDVLSPAVFASDDVVLVASTRVDREVLFHLVRVRTEDGRLAWSTYLGSAQSPDLFDLGATPSPPSVVSGRVFCLTNQGLVAAVDALDGVVLWEREYPTLSRRGHYEAIADEVRWHANPLLPLASGEILAAPQDAPFLYCLEPDGGLAWSCRRGAHSTLLGGDDDACFLGGREVSAVALRGAARGQVLWTYPSHGEEDLRKHGSAAPPRDADSRAPTPPPHAFRPWGRALVAGDRVLVSNHDALLQLDGRSGTPICLDLWDFSGAGGNLLRVGNHLAVTYAGGFLVYNDLESERRRFESSTPEQPGAALEKARFWLRCADVDRALGELERWESEKLAPPPPNSRLDRLRMEVAASLGQLLEFAPRAQRAALLGFQVGVESDPTARVRAAIELAQQLEAHEDPAGALRVLYQALDFARTAEPPASGPGEAAAPDPAESRSTAGARGQRVHYLVGGFLPVSAEEYLRRSIASLRDRAAAQRAEGSAGGGTQAGSAAASLDREAADEIEKARRVGSPLAIREVMRRFPFTPAAAEAYKDLAAAYRDRGSTGLSAQLLLRYLRDFPRCSDAARTKLEIANLLYESGERAKAKAKYLALLVDHPEERFRDVHGMAANETVRDYVERRLKDPGLADTETTPRSGLRFPYRMCWRSPADLQGPSRSFLFPSGPRPPGMERAFFTQSSEVIECRDLEVGVPLWTLHLHAIPGFVLDQAQVRFQFRRSGPREIHAHFAGNLLVLHDDRNLFAVARDTGKLAWHRAFGAEPNIGAEGGRIVRSEVAAAQRLSERLRGVTVAAEAVFATTTHKKLYRIGLDGVETWAAELSLDPAPFPPTVVPSTSTGDVVCVQSQRPLGFRRFRTADGREVGPVDAEAGLPAQALVATDPIDLGAGRLLLPLASELRLVDLAGGKTLWAYARPNTAIKDVFLAPEVPGEIIAVLNRVNNWPAVVGISLADGQELWRYEKFPAKTASFHVFRDHELVYVLFGDERWQLLALEIRQGGALDRPLATPVWPEREITLGTFYTPIRDLHIGEDSILFPAPEQRIAVYDRARGRQQTLDSNPLNRFLIEKTTYTSSLIGDRLVLLTDGGDCAFESRGTEAAEDADARLVDLVLRYRENPGSLESIVALSLTYFREEEFDAAVQVLDRALTSEAVLASEPARKQEVLGFLLEGIRQEAMKRGPGDPIQARRMTSAPAIDGELEDAWNYAYRVRIAQPRHVSSVSVPGQRREWEGEEDLSAVLYTGWDDKHFYFALDVEDDVLRAFDRDAENWKGDCLVIGLDPEGNGGYQQQGDDQLMTLALTIPKRKKPLAERDPEQPDQAEQQDSDKDEDEKNKPDGLFSVKKKDDGSGAVYEVALPWSSFPAFKGGREVSRGFSFGLSLLLTDDDTGRGATKTLSINPCHLIPHNQKRFWIWKHLVPAFFPKVTLR